MKDEYRAPFWFITVLLVIMLIVGTFVIFTLKGTSDERANEIATLTEQLDEQTYMTCWYGAQQFYTARGINADETFDLAKRDCGHAKATLTENEFNLNYGWDGYLNDYVR